MTGNITIQIFLRKVNRDFLLLYIEHETNEFGSICSERSLAGTTFEIRSIMDIE